MKLRSKHAVAITWSLGMLMAAAAVALYLLSMHRWSDYPPTAREQVLRFLALVAVPGFMSIGALIVSRRPRHRMGWLFLVTGMIVLASAAAGAYAGAGVRYDAFGHAFGRRFILPGQTLAAWFGDWLGVAGAGGALLFFPLWFPDGRIPSKRWRPVAWFFGMVVAVSVTITAFAPGPISDPLFAAAHKPFEIHALRLLNYRLQFLGTPVEIWRLAFLVGIVLASSAMAMRYVTAVTAHRPALRAFTVSASILGIANVVLLVQFVLGWGELRASHVLQTIIAVAIFGLAVAAAHAVFRHRLFEIDVVVRRTFVFGGTTVFLSLVYAATAVGLGATTARRGWLLSTAATAIAGAGLYPVRERAERLATRIVYGQRLEPYDVFARVARHLAEVPSMQGPAKVAEATGEGLKAQKVTVRVNARPVPMTYAWPAIATPDASRDERASTAVRFSGKHVGDIELRRAPGDSVTEQDRRVLAGVADLAAPAFANALTALELARRAEDVAAQTHEIIASRRRLSAAQLETRARFQLELAERVQARLDGLVEIIRSASLEGDVAHTLERAKERAEETLSQLRSIGRGLASSVLEARGLVAALRSLAQDAGAGVTVVASDEVVQRRFDPESEHALFFAAADLFKYTGGVQTIEVSLGVRTLSVTTNLIRGAPTRVRQSVVDRVGAVGGTAVFDESGQGSRVDLFVPITD